VDLPAGTVTLLFTDIEGSTRLIEELGEEGYVHALAEHRRLLRGVLSEHGGVEVDTQGDAFLYAFADPVEALAAAGQGQDALAPVQVKVRMGLQTGELQLTGEGYAGRELHRAARIAASGHGGQVVVSAATRAFIDGELTELGEHRLKDFDEPVALFQLGSDRQNRPFHESHAAFCPRVFALTRAPRRPALRPTPRLLRLSRTPGTSLRVRR
jgi:class 3 adenylate cyclase